MSFWQRIKRFFTGAAPEKDTTGPDAASPEAPSPAPKARRTARDRFRATEIMGLSAAALRRRAMRINPWRTAWIGRVDVIPPATDERTALIDRGLVLRGLLTEEQLAEIHEVGDQWLEHREAHLVAKLQAIRDADAAIEQLRRERVDRKAARRREAEERRAARARAVAERRATDIIYLGPGVSGGLNDRRSHVEALQEAGLPVLATPADVAGALGIPVPRLRWLCYHTEAAATAHYHWFEVPKRSGGVRLLAAPKPELARCQAWVRTAILDRLPVEPPAHGFVAGRSTVTNAAPHVGAASW